MGKNIIIYDVTLREGEQAVGVNFTLEEKRKIINSLVDLGIHHFEIGIVGNEDDEKLYYELSQKNDGVKNEYALTMLPFEKVFERVINDNFLFLNFAFPATSSFSKYVFLKDYENIKKQAEHWIIQLLSSNRKIKVVLCDASNQTLDKIFEQIKFFENLGIKEIILSDSLGVYTPEKVDYVSKALVDRFPAIKFGAHFHNDFGLALANSLIVIKNGFFLIQTSLNGLGERSGITSTVELVFSLSKLYNYNLQIDLKKLLEVSKKLSQFKGIIQSLFQPISGELIFTSQTATHTFALLKNKPEVVFPILANELGKHYEIFASKLTSKYELELLGYSNSKLLKNLKERVYSMQRKMLKKVIKNMNAYVNSYKKMLILLKRIEGNTKWKTD